MNGKERQPDLLTEIETLKPGVCDSISLATTESFVVPNSVQNQRETETETKLKSKINPKPKQIGDCLRSK